MDIRLIRNFEDGRCKHIKDDLILQETDDNYELAGFTGKNLYVVDVVKNTRQEIMPGVKKYNIINIIDTNLDSDSVYFTSAEMINEVIIQISLMRYSISSGENQAILTIDENLSMLLNNENIKFIILDENYVFVQKEIKREKYIKLWQLSKNNNENNYYGILDIQNYLYNIQEKTQIDICDSIIAGSGIDNIIKIDGNICAIKIGYTIFPSEYHNNFELDEIPKQVIGIINLKQFISDLVLKKEQVYIEVLNECENNETFAYLKFRENNIVFSKADMEAGKEEVIIYDHANNVTKVRINNNLTKISDLWHTYIICDTPYLVSVDEEGTHLINLNTQKAEWDLPTDSRIRYIKNDIIVVEKHTEKALLRKENNYITAYKYPDIEECIFTEKASYVECLSYDDNLSIFSN